MFTIPFYQYKINDWKNKKQEFVKLANQKEYYIDPVSNVYTNYGRSSSLCITNVFNLVKNEFILFNQQANLNSSYISDLWFQKYYKNQYHGVHNHGAIGFSSVLYIEFDKNEHKGTQFISPFTNPRGLTDTYNAEMTDPLSTQGTRVIYRGGSYPDNAMRFCRAASRGQSLTNYSCNNHGFRLCLSRIRE